ncbi:MAG: ABC transporter permease, partial [Candidatus Omnitrophica bacterium]|nr:ABC transporter permease [Candidatus Omnitrophota bacterium]
MIELKNISKIYLMGTSEVHALRNVSLRIVPGEFLAIMGPSGSGKSTMMHILGFLDRPDAGSYSFEGTALTGLSDDELAVIRNRLIGFVFQQFHLLPRMTVRENAELPLIYAGKRHLKKKAEEKITSVGLKERLNHHSNELSGGERQRVAIARALVNEPLIILADEPTGNLDSKNKDEIMAMLVGLNREGKTVILVTHEPDIAQYARRVIHMRDGEIVSDETRGQPLSAGASVSADTAIIELPLNKHNSKSPASIKELQGRFEVGKGKLNKDFLSKPARGIGGTEFLDYFRQAASAMVSHKMRSILSILGILIGVAAVIAMLALGEGAKTAIRAQLAALGSNLLVVRPGSPKLSGIAMESGSMTRFTFQDVETIRRMTQDVRRASPYVSGRGQVVYGSKNWNTQVEGVDVDYAPMRAAIPAAGRFFTEQEVKLREKVALLGTTVARELFGDTDPLGETIKINLVNFRIIGVLPEKGATSFRDQDDTILVPVTTAMYRLLGKQYVDNIFVEARAPEMLEQLTESLEQLIIKQHRLRKEDEDSFQIRNMADIRNTLETTTKTMSMLLGAIA